MTRFLNKTEARHAVPISSVPEKLQKQLTSMQNQANIVKELGDEWMEAITNLNNVNTKIAQIKAKFLDVFTEKSLKEREVNFQKVNQRLFEQRKAFENVERRARFIYQGVKLLLKAREIEIEVHHDLLKAVEI